MMFNPEINMKLLITNFNSLSKGKGFENYVMITNEGCF